MQVAFIDDRQSITYGELARRVNRFASGLRSIGVEREDRILLCMLDTIDWPTSSSARSRPASFRSA